MQYFFYFLEWLATFFVLYALNWSARYLLSKKFNDITTAIFAFIIVLFVAFLSAPYILTFPNPAYFYVPFLLFFLVKDIYFSMKGTT